MAAGSSTEASFAHASVSDLPGSAATMHHFCNDRLETRDCADVTLARFAKVVEFTRMGSPAPLARFAPR